jgi:hypothetical protein
MIMIEIMYWINGGFIVDSFALPIQESHQIKYNSNPALQNYTSN